MSTMLLALGHLNVDQKRADGKIAMIVLADHTPGYRAQQLSQPDATASLRPQDVGSFALCFPFE